MAVRVLPWSHAFDHGRSRCLAIRLSPHLATLLRPIRPPRPTLRLLSSVILRYMPSSSGSSCGAAASSSRSTSSCTCMCESTACGSWKPGGGSIAAAGCMGWQMDGQTDACLDLMDVRIDGSMDGCTSGCVMDGQMDRGRGGV
eukprot:353951-Chlamydomonas_euryale.AAC.6